MSFSFTPRAAYAYTVPFTALIGWNNAVTDQVTLRITGAGDKIIVNLQPSSNTAGFTDIHVTSVTDNQSNTYSKLVQVQYNPGAACNNQLCQDSEVWAATASSAGHALITASFSQNVGNGNFDALDVVGPAGGQFITATGTYGGVNSANFVTSTSLTYGTGDIQDASIETTCEAALVFSAGTGYTAVGGHAPFNGDAEFGTPPGSGVSNPTNFPASCSGNTNWLEAAVLIGIQVTSTTTVVAACTWYQLQCWWYPMLYFGVYGGVFMFTGGAGKVSPRGLTYLLLSGLTFAGLAMVLMDMISIMIPLMLTATTLLYVVRTR